MIKLGQTAHDKISGFEGIVTARTEWLNGCVRIHIEPTKLKDGQLQKAYWFDEPQLEIQKKSKKRLSLGGPARSVAPTRDE